MKRKLKILGTIVVVTLISIGLLFLWKPSLFSKATTTMAEMEVIPEPLKEIIELDTDFVDLAEYIPGTDVEIRYATDNNFMNKAVYDSSRAIIRRGTAKKLKLVAEAVAKQGYHLKIWDAYRPTAVQYKMWEILPDTRYVANPKTGSDHTRGIAVDITLVKADGSEVDMPSDFDDFTAKAGSPYPGASKTQIANANYLANAMTQAGFKSLGTEWWHFVDTDKDNYDLVEKAKLSSTSKANPTTKTTLVVNFIGDNTLGTSFNFKGTQYGDMDGYLSRYGPNYFYKNVQGIFEKDDLTVANFEGTITRSTERADKGHQEDGAFYFKGSVNYLDGLKTAGIDVTNIANNHSLDFGKKGYTDTQTALSKQGIPCFGYDNIAYVNVKGVKIALIGINSLGPLEKGVPLNEQKAQLDRLLNQAKADGAKLILASFHWGIEHGTEFTSEQKELAHYAIDQGAHQVIGHHPHVLQPIEIYKGKTIAYSIGNFVFGGNTKPADMDSVILQQTFVVDGSGTVQSAEPKLIPVLISSSSERNDYQPILAEGENKNRILKKLGR